MIREIERAIWSTQYFPGAPVHRSFRLEVLSAWSASLFAICAANGCRDPRPQSPDYYIFTSISGALELRLTDDLPNTRVQVLPLVDARPQVVDKGKWVVLCVSLLRAQDLDCAQAAQRWAVAKKIPADVKLGILSIADYSEIEGMMGDSVLWKQGSPAWIAFDKGKVVGFEVCGVFGLEPEAKSNAISKLVKELFQ